MQHIIKQHFLSERKFNEYILLMHKEYAPGEQLMMLNQTAPSVTVRPDQYGLAEEWFLQGSKDTIVAVNDDHSDYGFRGFIRWSSLRVRLDKSKIAGSKSFYFYNEWVFYRELDDLLSGKKNPFYD